MYQAAAATVLGSTTPTFRRNQGFAAAIVRNGAGDYTLTLDEAFAADELNIQCTGAEVGASAVCSGTAHGGTATLTTIRVNTIGDGGTPADVDFFISVSAYDPD
ncbi:hypothetical protein [Polyangium sp. 15x6]|uniref:hypothetical protein n=1 Tax=Polyangium sp. 15x6 TaxID=3042687 RepID=UPI00249BB4B2|nr:hypothetical protein [Polyangium sp. 15x6]MDI3285165.1 hypothetical protein [Polyangium sp. 15x6]